MPFEVELMGKMSHFYYTIVKKVRTRLITCDMKQNLHIIFNISDNRNHSFFKEKPYNSFNSFDCECRISGLPFTRRWNRIWNGNSAHFKD